MEHEKDSKRPESQGEEISGPAIMWQGKLYAGQIGSTHQQLFDQIRADGWSGSKYDIQEGYLTSTGRFVNRTEGWRIADAAGQRKEGPGHAVNWLISEELK